MTDPSSSSSNYVEMEKTQRQSVAASPPPAYPGWELTPHEISRLKELLHNHTNQEMGSLATLSMDSEYPEFTESTHAWAIFADDPKKRAGVLERVVGIFIIAFQLFTYWMFASEAMGDYQAGQVPVMVSHGDCEAADSMPDGNFQCEANVTNNMDAIVAFSMLGIFLTTDFLQAFRAIRDAPMGNPLIFACLAGVEVVCAFVAASIAVSYNLYIGEVTDAVEVGVGLLFVRDLSQRAYSGIRYKKTKQYRNFFVVLAALVSVGMVFDPLCERIFAA